MPKKETHIHKYERAKLGKKHIVLKCALIGCTHFIAKPLAIGRISQCWRCGEPFALTKASVELVRPHCISCTKRKEGKNEDKIDHTLIAEFLGDLEN